MNAPSLLESEKTPVDLLLEEQRFLTPAARFSRDHDSASPTVPGERHRDLIPLTAPAPNEQYAFEVDLDTCTGCKACVTACHNLNGLEEQEAWRDVGLLHGGDEAAPYQQTVTTACHHCVDPACLNGCPVLAYEKDPATGIVRHLDDQCIGCQYCVLKCPYDVPKYSSGKGIVRKCDMCHQRLAVGEAPACAQACPNEAIRIVTVTRSTVAAEGRNNEGFLPGAPGPDYTLPTTRYRSRRGLPDNPRPADRDALHPEETHLPLAVMLVLTQLSAGALTAAALAPSLASPPLILFACLTGLAGLNASLLHLGRPLKAWRAFLGWRKSWLSREILVFGAFGGAATAAAAGTVTGLLPEEFRYAPPESLTALLHPGLWTGIAAVIALAGVFCSAMIYHDTRRSFWRLPLSGSKFFGTAVVLGLAVAWAFNPASPLPPVLLAITACVKLGGEALFLRHARASDSTPDRKTALLQLKPLLPITLFRLACGLSAGVILPAASLALGSAPALAWLALAILSAGEFAERVLFFRSVAAPKMPGGIG